MRIALIQFNAQSDSAKNIETMQQVFERMMCAESPDWVLLPEVWDFAGGRAEDKRAAAFPKTQSPAYQWMQQVAKQYGVWIHGGSIFERDQDAIYNTTFVFDTAGNEHCRYRKLHLFDVITPDGQRYFESTVFTAGEQLVTYQAHGLTIGCAICYDLRFPELFQGLRAQGVHVLALPALFTLQTGKDHWEVLCRARAIETQSYVCAAGQCGSNWVGGEQRFIYGNSLVADPWGLVVARASEGVGWTATTLHKQYLEEVRSKIPLQQHKRFDQKFLIKPFQPISTT